MKASFKTDVNEDIDGTAAIFPIVKLNIDGELEFLATAFAIARNGILVTAKHVPFITDKKIHAHLRVIHITNGKYFIRPISRIAWHDRADIAVFILAEFKNNKTGEILTNKVMSLTSKVPKVGSKVATFAYPKTTIKKKDQVQEVDVKDSWYYGEVSEYFPNGRDRTFLPGKCFRTTLGFPGGASGGPVADENGKIFALNSTSIDFEGVYSDGHVSSLIDLLDIKIGHLEDGITPVYIRDLIDQKNVSME